MKGLDVQDNKTEVIKIVSFVNITDLVHLVPLNISRVIYIFITFTEVESKPSYILDIILQQMFPHCNSVGVGGHNST